MDALQEIDELLIGNYGEIASMSGREARQLLARIANIVHDTIIETQKNDEDLLLEQAKVKVRDAFQSLPSIEAHDELWGTLTSGALGTRDKLDAKKPVMGDEREPSRRDLNLLRMIDLIPSLMNTIPRINDIDILCVRRNSVQSFLKYLGALLDNEEPTPTLLNAITLHMQLLHTIDNRLQELKVE